MAKDSGTILLLGGAAALAYFGYTNGWFSSLFPATAAAPPPPPPPSGPPPPAPIPALGTTVTNANDALAQVAANDAFILPDAATFTTLQSALPSGYQVIQTTDHGGVLLRPDVYAAVQKLITNRVTRATSQGASTASIQAAGNITLGEIQSTMTSAGLTGLGDYRWYLGMRGYRV
jgi:hypothetical protein